MDLNTQKKVMELAEEYGAENLVVILGLAEAEIAGLEAETVIAGDPTFDGPLTEVPLGLKAYHVCETEIKSEVDERVYKEHVSELEMGLNIEEITNEMKMIREQFC